MSSMMNPAGGYRYIPGIPPYSAGVQADDDHIVVRTTLTKPTSWVDGFAAIDRVLADAGRPAQALCAVELRCPAPHSFDGFGSFNDDYRQALDERGILLPDGSNPVARTNVAPMSNPGPTTELHAFSYTATPETVAPKTVPGGTQDESKRASFVIAGAGDLADQADLRVHSPASDRRRGQEGRALVPCPTPDRRPAIRNGHPGRRCRTIPVVGPIAC